MSIIQSLTEWSVLSDKLRSIYPELAADDPVLVDTLDGETDLTEKLIILTRSAEDDRTLVAALSIRIAEMDERRKRIELRMERKRELVSRAMSEVGLKRLSAPDFTASLSQGRPSVIITSEDDLPAIVLKPQPPKPDKTLIKAMIEAGTSVSGAVLSNASPHLSVRRT